MTSDTKQLTINDLSVAVEGNLILHGVNLTVPPGQIHALMGPNGSGKSTLAYTLMGHPKYEVTGGRVTFGNHDLLQLPTNERAKLGVFLSFQYPTAIPGVTTVNFLRAALRAQDKETPARQFLTELNGAMKALNIDEAFRSRYINDGFSGGEKKRMEILQLALLKPQLAILDETDSGLDVDALRTVAEGVVQTHRENPATSILIITHYPRILEYLQPDVIHVMSEGSIVHSGGHDLSRQIEAEGYEPLLSKAGQSATSTSNSKKVGA